MADNTKIEWTDATWNPITGCSVVSAGCRHCYAMKLAGTRLQHHPSRAGLTINTKEGPVWNGRVRFNEEWLTQPLAWKRPRKVFVCAHGDLFHEAVPDAWIDSVFSIMIRCQRHTFQVLTKRPSRMLDYCTSRGYLLPNVWLGVSVEDPAAADERIPLLLQTPAAVRWVSAEPLLGPIDLNRILVNQERDFHVSALQEQHDDCYYHSNAQLDWVVVGGESGPNARPMHPGWARSLRDQCAAVGVPFLFKQHGEWISDEDIDNCNLSSPEIADADQYFRRAPWPSGAESYRVGKKAAGRLLDGVQHDSYPEARP